MKRYRFLTEADAEFREHTQYFDEQVAGLGDKFITDLQAAIREIREYPESGALVSRNLRKRVLRVFRHTVFYVNGAEEIIIVAVAAHRRRPHYWRKRLKDLPR